MASPLAQGTNFNKKNSASFVNCKNKTVAFLGLFSKGIASSGADVASWAQSPPGMARMRAIQLAEQFHCLERSSSRVDWSATMNCLRKIPAKNMSAVLYDFYVNIVNVFRFFNINSKWNLIILIRNTIWIQKRFLHQLLSQNHRQHS